MLKIFKIWLGLTIISWGLYTPFYLISNNPIDAVEELTIWAYTPATNAANLGYDYSEIRDRMSRMGVDIDMDFEDAVDDNPLLSNLDVSYVESGFADQLQKARGLRLVRATIDVDGGYQLAFVFLVTDKSFPRAPISRVIGMSEFSISSVDFQADLTAQNDAEAMFMLLFHKQEEARAESIQKMIASYKEALYEDVATNPRPDNAGENAPSTLGDVLEAAGMSSEPIVYDPNADRPVKNKQADSKQSLDDAITGLLASVTAETGTSEYTEAREVLETQIVGSEATDAAVLYTMEGNIATRYLAVLEQTDSGYQLAGNTTIELGAYELSADNGVISVKTLTHALEDPMCCPTLETVYRYRPEGGQLVMIQ